MISRAIEEAWSAFSEELNGLRDLRESVDSENGMPAQGVFLVYESIILRAFRSLENALEHIFYAYLLEKRTHCGRTLITSLDARDRNHVMQAVTGADRWADWADPSLVRDRANVFICLDNPLSLSLETHLQSILWMKAMRNHVAHNSPESYAKYEKTLVSMLATAPSEIPTIGEFLRFRPTKGPVKNREVLAFLLEQLEKIMTDAMEKKPDTANKRSRVPGDS